MWGARPLFFGFALYLLAADDAAEELGIEAVLVGVAAANLDAGEEGGEGQENPGEGCDEAEEPADAGDGAQGDGDNDDQGGQEGEV